MSPSHEAILHQYEIMLADFRTTLGQSYVPGEMRMDLSLKMVVHYGIITHYQINDINKLYGEVVLKAHLLLKNEINSHSYVLMTEDYMHSLNNRSVEGYRSKVTRICERLGGIKNVCYSCYDFSKAAV